MRAGQILRGAVRTGRVSVSAEDTSVAEPRLILTTSSMRIDRLRHCAAWSMLFRRHTPTAANMFMADLYEREGSHLLASLGPEELGRVLSQRYDRHPVPDYERLLATTHAHLQRQAVAALGVTRAPRCHAGDRDPYVLWVHAQLDLLARFLGEIDPRTEATRQAIEHLLRRVRLDRVRSPNDAARPAVEVATELLGNVQVYVGLYWNGSTAVRAAMIDCDMRGVPVAPGA